MNQLSLVRTDRHVIDLAARRQATSNVRRLAAARAKLRAALVCRWRRDPATEAMLCVWTVSRGAREPASPVHLRLAS